MPCLRCHSGQMLLDIDDRRTYNVRELWHIDVSLNGGRRWSALFNWKFTLRPTGCAILHGPCVPCFRCTSCGVQYVALYSYPHTVMHHGYTLCVLIQSLTYRTNTHLLLTVACDTIQREHLVRMTEPVYVPAPQKSSTESYTKFGLRKPSPLLPEMTLMLMVFVPATRTPLGMAKSYS